MFPQRLWVIAACNGVPFSLRASCRMSMTRTSGIFLSSARCGSWSSAYFPFCALWKLSSEGVAEPSTTTAPSIWPRTTATSRAW